MASLLLDFEYDIFISYRQKDNKGDRWVSEFVETLKTELEATFKEEVCVYFDINPHDGLLETHDVDASLKDKLKCLVFIPIISQTYCDSNSFAWQHEFCTFNKSAKEDQFGRDIRLTRGNVASRILPVKIHDLDPEDKTLFENELGGALRCIEFIFKSAGVNRPLRANEDHPQDNLNKTYYRDQINKVANAIKEIITTLKKSDQQNEEVSKEDIKPKPGQKKDLRTIIILATIIVLVLIPLGYLFIPKLSESSEKVEKSIAVLPFDNMSDNKEYAKFGDAMTDEIIIQLYKIKKFIVRSRTSVMQYKSTDKTIREIGRELNVNFIVEGSVQRFEDQFRIRVQLIRTKTDEHLWGETYENNWNDILSIQSDIAKRIADNLETVLTPEEIEKIEKNPTVNINAYSKYISGNTIYDEARNFLFTGNRYTDSSSFEYAIKMYDKAIELDSVFALAYARRAITRSWGYFSGVLPDKGNIEKCRIDIEKAKKIDSGLAEVQIASGFYYYYCRKDYQNALNHFINVANQEPGNWEPKYYIALVNRRLGNWVKSQELLSEVLKYDLNSALILTNIGVSYDYLRNYDTALIYHERAIEILPIWPAPYLNKIGTLLLKEGNTKEARHLLDSAVQKTGKRFQRIKILLDIYDHKFEEALNQTDQSDPSDFENQGDVYLHYAMIHNYLNNSELSEKYYDSARVFLENELIDDPENPIIYSRLGIADAGLKNKLKAIENGEKAVTLSYKDALDLSENKINLAKIYIMSGDHQNGLKLIDELLKEPSLLSIELLQLDPDWKPIRENPEFKRILMNYSKN